MDKKFAATFDRNNWPVTNEWSRELENYIIHGYPPGSFFEAIFSNDLYRAACCSHPSNTWPAIITVVKWLLNEAPRECFGSRAKVDAWLAMSNDDRRKICEEQDILMSAWDHLKEKEPA
jgi:hypothetical protein